MGKKISDLKPHNNVMYPANNTPQQNFLEWCISWGCWGAGTVLMNIQQSTHRLLVDLNTWNDLIFKILQTTAFIISITVGVLTLLKLLGYRLPQIPKLKRKKKNDN